MNKFTVIDMFSGCGGLSRGFIDAGFEVLLGVDIDTAALQTFEYNHKGAIGFKGNLFDKDIIHKIDKAIKHSKVDVIIGGPPCQGFSLTGKRQEDDERNRLFLSMVEAVKYFRPKAFILENVPSLATLYDGKVKDAILKEFGSLGYKINFKVLYAPDYGIPQIRKRIFFVGLLSGEDFAFPSPTTLPEHYLSCEQAISDLPSLEESIGKDIAEYQSLPQSDYQSSMRATSSTLLNHVGTSHTELVKSVIRQVPEGGNYRDLPEGVGESRKFNDAWTRYHSKKPARTIDTGHRNHFHYKWDRVPTVRESARLQSFPDDFKFFGNKTEQYRQVGNAVPPLLGYHLAKQLLGYLE